MTLLETTAGILQTVNKKIDAATQKITDAGAETKSNNKVSRLLEAARAVLGDDFQAIPLFKYTNATDISAGLKPAQANQLLKFMNTQQDATNALTMETWMESVASVRPHLRRLEQVRMISETQGGSEVAFTPAQMPLKENDSWLAVEFPEIDARTGEPFDPKDDTICLAIHGDHAHKTAALQSALVVDEWTEFIPNRKEVTGIAFNYDQPNATAPNALLLAVEPTGAKTWNWDILMGILDDTLRRVKSRAVEPSQLLEDIALDTLSPMTVANFDLQKTGVSLDYLVTSDALIAKVKDKNYALYKDFKV